MVKIKERSYFNGVILLYFLNDELKINKTEISPDITAKMYVALNWYGVTLHSYLSMDSQIT